MLTVTPHFHVHQPYRLKQYRVFDIGFDNDYFNDAGENERNNRRVLERVVERSYRPMNALLEELLAAHPDFRFALSFSGTALAQLEAFAPDVLESFRRLVRSDRVEVLADTSHHTLAFFFAPAEFARQVRQHERHIKKLFGVTPKVFRNTELSYRNDLATWCEQHGYRGIMTTGAHTYLGWRSPNHVYRPVGCKKLKLLLKNDNLSDDVAVRFSDQNWASWPMSAETYAGWIKSHHGHGDTVTLSMDYDVFGERQSADSGIFSFMRALPTALTSDGTITFRTPSETLAEHEAVGEYDVADILAGFAGERDLTPWAGSDIQRDAIHNLYALEEDIVYSGNRELLEQWRRLQTAEHFYYMSTKWTTGGNAGPHRSPYQSPYEAYMAFMNALSDLQLRVTHAVAKKREREERKAVRVEKEPTEHDDQHNDDGPAEPEPESSNEQHESVWAKLKQWLDRFRRAVGLGRPAASNPSS